MFVNFDEPVEAPVKEVSTEPEFNKNLLRKVDELELTLKSLEYTQQMTKDDLSEATNKLANINKPIINKETVEQIRQAVHDAVRNARFDDVDSYTVDFEIDYNNSLALSSIDFNLIDDLEETIFDYVEDVFNVIED